MNKRLVAVIATIVLTFGGVTALLVHTSRAEERAFEGAELVEVLRVSEPIPAGANAETVASAVERAELPATAVVEGAMATLDNVGDQVTATALVPGEQLLDAKFVDVGDAPQGEVPEDLQAISIQVGAAPSVAASLAKGDLVGLIANYGVPTEGRSNFLAEQITVVEVAGGSLDAEGAAGGLMVTLAVDGRTAKAISNASSFGTIWITHQTETTEQAPPEPIDEGDVLG